jgi:hypothetical protein
MIIKSGQDPKSAYPLVQNALDGSPKSGMHDRKLELAPSPSVS